MDLPKAIELLAQPKKGRGKASAMKEFGNHPIHQMPVSLFNGPYGPYIKAGKTNASLPEGVTADTITPEKAFELINEKLGTTRVVEKSAGGKKKATKKKAPAKKAAAAVEATPAKKIVLKKAKK
jgi:DNA topoisomerase-1